MKTTLCFDFGNTRLKCAIFYDDELSEVIVLNDDHLQTIDELLQRFHPDKTILSSVINHSPEIEKILAKTTSFHKLSYQSKLPFTTPVGKPETIGADRLALCAAAVAFHPRKHNLVVALGSCITFNFINKWGEFLGGSISPGLEMRFKAMYDHTALLPIVEPDWNFPLIGYDTRTNLLSGVILGMSKEIDGVVDEYNKKYNNLSVHLTGGNTSFFMPHLQNNIHADDNFLYKGLYAISEAN